MLTRLHSHRHALQILETVPEYRLLLDEINAAILSLTDEAIVNHFEQNFQGKPTKSLSKSLNDMLEKELVDMGWNPQSQIFGNSEYGTHTWRLDFAKQVVLSEQDQNGCPLQVPSGVSLEVAFNHQGNIAWNLLKPVIASEINHVEKALQTGVGIVVCATDSLKEAGGFDSAVGTYEQFVSNLLPLRNFLTVPVLIVGLEAPKSFRVGHQKIGTQTFGFIERI